MIFHYTASDERAAGAEALSTSPGPLAAGFLVTHFEERQDGRWREPRRRLHSHLASAPASLQVPAPSLPPHLQNDNPRTILGPAGGWGGSEGWINSRVTDRKRVTS